MKKSNKELLFERMEAVNPDFKRVDISEEIDPQKQYIDKRTGNSYSGEQVLKWVNWYKNARRISKKDRENALNMFNALGLSPKEYAKEKWVNPNKLKLVSDGAGGYFAEGELDNHLVRLEITPQETMRGYWCYEWLVIDSDKADINDPEWYYSATRTTDDCLPIEIRVFRKNLDALAKEEIETYKNERY